MKSAAYLAAVLAVWALPAFAAPMPPMADVPDGHWAAGAVRRVTESGLMTPNARGQFNGNKPVTRYELAVTLDRLVHFIEASHKPLSASRPVPVSLPRAAPPAAAVALQDLVGNGFLPRKSPLLTHDGGRPATARELADALAQVTIRLSDRSLPPQKD